MRRGSTCLIVMLMLLFLSTNALSKIEIGYSPSKPKAGDTVKFYLNITGNVSNVRLWIEECKGDQCFLPKILNMEQTGLGNYTAEYKLRNDTTLVHYKVNISFQNGSYVETKTQEFEVEPQVSMEDGKKKTPGFEVYGILISITISILISRGLSR